MSPVGQTCASLRCATREPSAAFVGDALQCEPTRLYALGEPTHSRRPSSKPREESLWILESPLAADAPLEAHLEHLLAFVERRADAFDALRSRLVHADFFCLVGSGNQGSLNFAPELLARIAARHIELALDLYLDPSD
ncbi:MAG: DUF4279 domain-containing protein [Planctomycetes bacterium]|nr:DUF4279 domain-containing protein [Planctomycetota bacterium]